MNAIILAAGASRRMVSLTKNIPKCLLKIGDKSIIEHQIASLYHYGLDEIIMVTGFCEDKIKSACGDKIRYITNPRFAETNSIYSLWLAKEETKEGFIVINSDVLFHPLVLGKLLESPYPDALTVSEQEEMGDEEMKVKVNSDRVIDISKAISPQQADGENVGMVKFSSKGAEILFKKIDELISKDMVNKWAPFAFQQIASYHHLYAVDIGDLPWIEIDFVEDYERAKEVIYPRILNETYSV
ncbi:MAG: phosphocholine cytidylyltransferase family protein [Deltaproteobacteria bacterium]|nr:phosphocholine cytidylyltransferase family protein [Deltaproteobacteria bacterium]